MNKKIILVLLTAIGLVMSCANDDSDISNDKYLEIPDNYFEKKLIEQGIDSDGIVNQQMLKSDAEKISILNLNISANHGEVVDLKGIEGFVNLKELYASGQKIVHVDLRANILLETLHLIDNKISNIDLSNNKNLIFIDLQSNEFSSTNSITGLSNATNLKDLDLSWNYLEEFSIHNELLEVLHISHNDLKLLNTSGVVNLKNVYAPSNKLEIVDFSTNALLETLLVQGNKLQQINLENNTKLTHLYISTNSLVSIDVSNNKKLVNLKVDRNPNLTCIKIENGQNIGLVSKSDYQELNNTCN